MISIAKQSAFRHGYLFITAAWLYTLSFLFTNYFSFDSSSTKVAKTLGVYLKNYEKRFVGLLNDSAELKLIISNKPTDAKSELVHTDMGLFIYSINTGNKPKEVYWNKNTMAVSNKDLLKPDGKYPVQYQKNLFELLKQTTTVDGRQFIVAGLIPVHWQYAIEGEYLQNRFAAYSDLENNYTVSLTGPGTPVLNSGGQATFYIEKKNNAYLDHPGNVSIVLRVIAIIILMIFINALATELAENINLIAGLLFLLIVVILTRTLSYFIPFPFDLKSLDLFSPYVYASSVFHPSLGDLLVNTILLFWLVSFVKFNIKKFDALNLKLGKIFKTIIGVASLLVLPMLTFAMADFLSSLIKDSSDEIPFNVSNFFSLNIYTIISFFIICILILSYFYLSQFLARFSEYLSLTMYWKIIILLSSVLLLLTFKITDNNDTIFNFGLVIWLVIFYVLLSLRKADVPASFYNSGFFMPWSIFLMASVSALLIYQNKSLELDIRKKIAEKLSSQSDPANEKILNVALAKFDDFFAAGKYKQFYNEQDNRFLKKSIINNNFLGYLNNFDTRIYTYDYKGNPLYNTDSTSYDVVKSVLLTQGKLTDIPDLYYYENASDKFSYIYEQNVYDADSFLLGHAFLVIVPKTSKEVDLEPQLFRQLTNDIWLIGSDYTYAIYDKDMHLQKSTGNYNFSDIITKSDIPQFESVYKTLDNYSELWYRASDNKVIVVARKNDWFVEFITFFAYLFGLLIVLVLIQHFGHLIFKTGLNWDELTRIFRFDIRTQIQVIIVAVSFIAFIVIGITTISFFIIRFNNDNDKKLIGTSRIIVNEIEHLGSKTDSIKNMFDLKTLDLNLDMEKKIIDIAEIHNIDVNFFDLSGNLQVTSQDYVYDNNILSRKMNPVAYNEMHYNRSTQFIQKEEVVKNFSYLSIYVPVKNNKGNTLAYLNIPFINSQNELNQEISNFLITLINLNALIFILAGGIALWVTRRITSSFTLIGNKMKAISFGSVNEEIDWKKNDEIGELVSEYNKMVKKLAQSAQALARSEREGAWREMARQVAHEIKNPLTPMKLSIQYLERAIDKNATNVKALSKQVANTLVEQIDQLSKIAGDFSQFANIANVQKEVFDLSEVIKTIIQLFSADERIHINWLKENGTYKIEADKTQINRLFTNLVKNAIEAYPEEEKAEINIRQVIRKNEIVVSVQDFGHGIPHEMQPKIFAPNFTTKSSGTGLGLAICKGIVEKANGQILFETKENEGTEFFVSLPAYF